MIKDWEVVEDLQVESNTGGDNPGDLTTPGICEGYLLKRRKWPLKGWHKVRLPSIQSVLLSELLDQTKVMMSDVSSSDTLSWKQGSCATPKANKT